MWARWFVVEWPILPEYTPSSLHCLRVLSRSVFRLSALREPSAPEHRAPPPPFAAVLRKEVFLLVVHRNHVAAIRRAPTPVPVRSRKWTRRDRQISSRH